MKVIMDVENDLSDKLKSSSEKYQACFIAVGEGIDDWINKYDNRPTKDHRCSRHLQCLVAVVTYILL